MKKVKSSFFELNLGAAALAFAIASSFPANVAQANAGFGTITDLTGAQVNVPTYYASSPQGIRPAFDPVTHALSTTGLTVDTGTPIRKFVDPLGGVYNGLETLNSLTDLQAGIPVALARILGESSPGTSPRTDYYEIGVVEYTEQLHSDLAKPTRLRGYVQIETANLASDQALRFQILLRQLVLTSPQWSVASTSRPSIPMARRFWMRMAPRFTSCTSLTTLAPSIVAASGTPIRIKFTNYLPYTDVNWQTQLAPPAAANIICRSTKRLLAVAR